MHALLLSLALAASPERIRVSHHIPELAYVVVSSQGVIQQGVFGVQRAGSALEAKEGDRFHLGSNTKALTALLAALLVKQHLLSWDTKALEQLPELARGAHPAYANVTLRDLVTFRGKLPPYTYTAEHPTPDELHGTDAEQREGLVRFLLAQPPKSPEGGLTPSNGDYVLAGLMLERASGKTYRTLVDEFGRAHGIAFGFDYPNLTDAAQPWGHDEQGKALPPQRSVKLNWLLAAGNVNVSITDYAKFLRLLLQGLRGEWKPFSAAEVRDLLYGRPPFSYGWWNHGDLAHNEGNAGAFLSEVEVNARQDRAYAVLVNVASEEARLGALELMSLLRTPPATPH